MKETITAQKITFSIKDFFSKCVEIRSFFGIWSHLLKKSLMENFFAVYIMSYVRKPWKKNGTGNCVALDPIVQSTCSIFFLLQWVCAKYLFNIFPTSVSIYNTKAINNIPLFRVKHNFIKNSIFHFFFCSYQKEYLDQNICNSKRISSTKHFWNL